MGDDLEYLVKPLLNFIVSVAKLEGWQTNLIMVDYFLGYATFVTSKTFNIYHDYS